MHIKALAAAFTTAVLSAAIVHTAHAMALSPSTTSNTNVSSGSSVTVAPGDTLSTIATENGTTYVRLFDANSQISSPDLIYSGETIAIPDANAQLPNRMGDEDASPATTTMNTVSPESKPQSIGPISATAVAQPAASASDNVWTKLAQCESGGNWAIDTGNGYYGGLQFTLSSWQSVGGTGYPNQASESEQISRAQMLQAKQGWSAWPSCSAKLGL